MDMSSGWSIYIIVLVAAHIVGYLWLLFTSSRMQSDEHKDGDTTGHVWDDDLKEYNNPLPKWWLYLFILTIVFSIVYLTLYPGMGNYKGTLNWTSFSSWEDENKDVMAKRAELFSTFINKPVTEMVKDTKAMEIGERLFANHCSTCHGSDAQGAVGFPNLTDNDWLYGGDPDTIIQSITAGRNGIMPPWGAALGDEGVKQVAAYVKSFTDKSQNVELAAEGQKKFAMFCSSCHGADAKGNYMFGAPNLTDNTWLHSYDSGIVETAIMQGLSGKMPAHGELLDKDSIKVLGAYVYSLSND